MFFGEYEHSIDQKGRLALPVEFAQKFKEGGVLVQGLEKCITVYTLAEWEKLAETLASLPSNRSKSRRINRFTLGTAFSSELDNKSRITLPLPLRKYADIKDTVIIVGVNKYLELWSKKLWDLEKSLIDEKASWIFESQEL